MTSNVSQNYPYTSETEAERVGGDREPRRRARRTRRQAGERDDAARRQRALVGLEVPDAGLPGPPPRRRLRGREARRLRRLRRDLRQDVPALTAETTGGPVADRPQPPATDAETVRTSRRRLVTDAIGIGVSAAGFGFVYGLSARQAGFSPIEAMAMSMIVFAGAAQFAAVGYVASGLAWPGIVLLTALLNARHLLYSAALAPWLRSVPLRPARGDGPPPDRRGVRAVDRPLPADRPGRRARLLDRGHRLDLHPVEPRDAGRRPARRPRSRTRHASGSTSSSRPR